ncbi:hypothetical protein Lesp02_59150 [Lentzea sp. NBRC 105346]|uniref:ABC transporter substrate-binding protein n=1 Tax=Lentzea sp. NBRC 105346 TaxID=3032205 RepID=UPI0024A3D5F2|nr:ABC transporter substrate-binding protein [Lentzea sp. NBRC 105346]GLZ33727.1 hypothetical protein Lesp02_59150 [Lentzea sp. NBRC 105346]
MRLAAVLIITGLLAGCSAAPDTGQGWSFTDDRNETVSARERPQRIIAQVSAAGALTDFGVKVTGTFGPLKKDDGTVEAEAGSVDPASVTDVTGGGYGELNLEKIAGLSPDLLVSGKYAEYAGLWHVTEEQEKSVRKMVPTVGILQSGKALPDTIARYRDLAKALGGDVDSARVKADFDAFTKASDRIRSIGSRMRAENKTVLAVGGTTEGYFVAVPARAPDLAYYVSLGLPITTPANPDLPGGGYFERLSWENAGTYRPDVLLWDTRRASNKPEEMKQHPVFAALPAAAANRFVGWDAVAPMSYASYAKIMNRLADQLEISLGR